jgi:hypothetical protein
VCAMYCRHLGGIYSEPATTFNFYWINKN